MFASPALNLAFIMTYLLVIWLATRETPRPWD